MKNGESELRLPSGPAKPSATTVGLRARRRSWCIPVFWVCSWTNSLAGGADHLHNSMADQGNL